MATVRVAGGRGPRPGDVVRDPLGGGRETVESVVVAFTLALIFRAFEAEAFVIPTGSMAPTLMGRHRDLVCETCGEEFRVGASKELDEATCRLLPENFVRRARCPNCGVRTRLVDAAGGYEHRFPPFAGDRIIVEKFAYDFVEPSRWDVVVFKFPEDARINYIKRLVGLPGETVVIAGGDIWTSRGGGEPGIARKPPERLVGMLQCVSDSAHVPRALVEAGWPTAWTDWRSPGSGGPRWQSDDLGRSFAIDARGGTASLRWRRFVPADGPAPPMPEPALVGDFQPYNQDGDYVMHGGLKRNAALGALVDGAHWVGDLAVELELETRGDTGSVTLDLVEAGRRHACTLDLATGRATLVVAGGPTATAATPVRGRGRWRILVANVDDELSLFVGGRRIATDVPTTWRRPLPAAGAERPAVRGGTPGDAEPGDLAPVGITTDGADVRVADMRVLRDVYYVSSGLESALVGRDDEEPSVQYPLGDDQFFMLGDNSTASKDGRAWGTPDHPLHHVDRRLLVGRAMVVFWPHAVPTPWNVTVARRCGWELRLPCLPNFARMRVVR